MPTTCYLLVLVMELMPTTATCWYWSSVWGGRDLPRNMYREQLCITSTPEMRLLPPVIQAGLQRNVGERGVERDC